MEKNRNRHIHRTLFFCISLSLALWRLPPMIEKFNERIAADTDKTNLLHSALNSSTGAGNRTATQPGNTMVLLSAKGRELTPDQRSKLLRNARRLAPLSHNQESKATPNARRSKTTPNSEKQATPTIQELQQQAEKALKEIKKPD